MKNIRLMIRILLIIPGMIIGAESQSFDLVIIVDKNRSILMDEVSPGDFSNYDMFNIPFLPSDRCYCVRSACYQRAIDSKGCYSKVYDVVKKIPSCWIASDHERKNYLFPRYIPKSFVETIEKNKTEGNVFSHVLEVKDKKKIIFNYLVEYTEKQNETGGEQIIPQISPVATPSHQDYVVDLLTFLSFIFF